MAMGILTITSMNDRVGVALRTVLSDLTVPVFAAVANPVRDLAFSISSVETLFQVHQDNLRLKEENARLRAWYDKAMMLEARHVELAKFMNLIEDGKHSFVTVRALTDHAGGFVQTIMVAGGTQSGLRPDQAALVPEGLVGRVVEAGRFTARILLLTDTSSRVPIFIEQSRTRAILAGDNSAKPVLMHLPVESDIQVGQRVVTSGHGGIFPANIPVGVVESVDNSEIRVRLFADFNRFEYVQIADYRLNNQ